ncbi:glycosyltransferase [Paenibacillus sp. VCA1]|uniref:glycosyltransferase n=1 Tax=Paenibacillus sp. VCA1 TaxID=3039148 RepID=UPI00287162DD|nr:glycosyltransferase [Paenibacillus sp. VCA1]MDR9853301.1 glycosyltransferase [Paenibacillus sp. VCA1]
MIEASYFLKDTEIYQSENLIDNPKISVVLPTYCRGDNGLLSRSIESVLNQSFRELELIIVDDGSIDKTRSVVMEYLSMDNRIVYIRNNVNSGLPALRVNQGILHSRGKYIAYQFDDDQWYSDAMQVLFNSISKFDEPCLVYGKCKFVDLLSKHEIIFGEKFNFNMLRLTNTIANNTVLHHRQIAFDYGGYEMHVSMKRLCDWDLWLRWSEKISIHHVDHIVSLVEGNQIDSLGRTAVLDQSILKYLQTKNDERNYQLRVDNTEYCIVDSIEIVDKPSLKELLYVEHLLPWYRNKLEISDQFEPISVRKETIVVVIQDYNGTTNIMITNFVKFLKNKFNTMFVSINHLDHRLIDYADVVILQRLTIITPELKRLINKKPTIYLMDDNLLELYTLPREEFKIFEPNTENYKVIVNYLKSSDLILTPNKNLTHKIKNYNENIFQIPTNILGEKLNDFSPRNGKLKVAWIGYESREEELVIFSEDIDEIAKSLSDEVEFYFIGSIPLKNVDQSKYKFINRIDDYEEYLLALKDHSFDIIVSVIENSSFKNSKSPIKFLETTASGALGIYSNEIVYEMISDTVTGFMISNKPGELIKKVREILQLDNEKLLEIHKNALDIVKNEYTTESNFYKFIQMIELVKFNYSTSNRKVAYVVGENFNPEQLKEITRLGIEPILMLGKKLSQDIIKLAVDNNWDYYSCNIEEIVQIASNNRVGLIHDFTNNDLIQWYCYRESLPYLQNNSFETLCSIEGVRGKEIYSLLLKLYTQHINRFNNKFEDEYTTRTHSSKEAVNKLISIPLNENKIQIYSKDLTLTFTCLGDTLAGIRVNNLDILHGLEMSFELRTPNRGSMVLRTFNHYFDQNNGNSYQEILFDKPIYQAKNIDFLISIKTNKTSRITKDHVKLMGMEAIYQF